MRGLVAAFLLGAASVSLACGYVPKDLWEKTWKHARAWGIDPYFLAALVWVESRYCPHAVGRAGEVGLGQFMPGTWQAATGAPLHWRRDPDWALWATAKHLRTLWETHRDWRKVLWAYNAGSGAVFSGKVPASTKVYAERVLAVYARWRGGNR
jgi:soluble lytic murein transglycosylase-like protein